MAYIGKRPQDTFPAGNAVNAATIAANAVGASELAINAVTTNTIADNAVTAIKIATNAIVTEQLAQNSVTATQIPDSTIGSDQIAGSAVITAKINADAVTGAKIADDAIDSEHLVDGSIDTAHIGDLQVTTAKITDNAVTLAKMAGLARGKIIIGDSSGDPAALAVGSNGQVLTSDGTDISWGTDAVLTTENVQDIAGGMFTGNTETGITATYQDGDGTVDLVIGTLNQDTTGLAATATALATARTIGGVSFDGTANINLPGVNAAGSQDTSGTATLATSITASANNSTDETVYPAFVDGATGTQGIETDTGLTYNPSTGVLTTTSVTGNLTGNVTGNVTGNTSGTAATVTGGTQAAITSAANLVTVGTIGTGVWQGTAIASGYIAGDAITGAKIADDAIDSEHYTDGSIDTAHIAASQITNTLMADDAIDSAEIADGAIDTVHIADDQVTAAKLANTAVTPAAYGSSSAIPVITIDAQGRITAASTAATSSVLTIAADSGSNDTVTVGTDTFTFEGTANEIETTVSNNKINFGLPTNVTIAGNLTVAGTQTTVSSTTITVADPLVALASGNNAADAVDIGLYGLYDTSGSQDLYSGLFRDASDSGKWKLFKDNQAAPTTTVNTSGTGYAVGTLVANLEGNVTGNVTGNTSGSSGSTTGNAATATALATARTIGGTSFDGTANIAVGLAATATALASARTIHGVSFDGTANIDLSEVVSDTVGAMFSSNTETGITATYQDGDNTIDLVVGTLNQDTTGTAALATSITAVANNSTDETVYPTFIDGATGTQGIETDTGLTYNPSSGILTATQFTGAVVGNVTGNASGTAATVTGGTQAAITSAANLVTVGTIGTGVWQGTAIASGYIAADAITGAKIADDAIDSEHYTDGSIDTAHIADDQVTLAKMAGLARGKIIYGDSSGNPTALALGSNGQVLKSDGSDIAWASDSGLSTEEVQDIAGGMFTGNTETGITATYQDGDGTIDLVIGDNSIVAAMIAENVISTRELAANTIATGNIADNAVDGTKIAQNSILTRHIDDNQITGDQIADDIVLSGTGAIRMPDGTTAQRPGSAAAGMFRYNTTTSAFEGYTDSWGSVGGSGASTFTRKEFTGDGSETDFTLDSAPSDENDLMVFIEGVYQNQDAYSVSGTTLTMADAPVSGRGLVTYHVSAAVAGAGMAVNTMTGDNSDTTLTLAVAPGHVNNVQVFFDGVYQKADTYSVSGTTLTFGTAPPTGVLVEARTHAQTEINTFPATGISGLTQVTAAGADHFMIYDATDSALKKALVSDVLDNVVLTDEQAQDIVGAMFTSNTETGITATYQDADGTVDLVVGTLNQDTTGTADLITATANNSANETVYPTFVDGATGSQGIETDTGLTYNPSTGMLTSTGLTGTLTGNVTGNVTGNTSGTAATVTTGAQPNITSTGTLTSFRSTGIDDNADALAITIDSGEQVGIGTTSPDARLDIEGMVAGEQALLITSARNDALSNGLARINITDPNCPFNGLQIDHAGTSAGSGAALAVGGYVTVSKSARITQGALTSSSNAVAWDARTISNAYHVTTENTTFSAPSNAVEGAIISVELAQGGTARTVAWNTVFEFAASTAPTVTATANKTDIFSFRYNGSVWQEIGRVQNMAQT